MYGTNFQDITRVRGGARSSHRAERSQGRAQTGVNLEGQRRPFAMMQLRPTNCCDNSRERCTAIRQSICCYPQTLQRFGEATARLGKATAGRITAPSRPCRCVSYWHHIKKQQNIKAYFNKFAASNDGHSCREFMRVSPFPTR